jgi:hypothetical protein
VEDGGDEGVDGIVEGVFWIGIEGCRYTKGGNVVVVVVVVLLVVVVGGGSGSGSG